MDRKLNLHLQPAELLLLGLSERGIIEAVRVACSACIDEGAPEAEIERQRAELRAGPCAECVCAKVVRVTELPLRATKRERIQA